MQRINIYGNQKAFSKELDRINKTNNGNSFGIVGLIMNINVEKTNSIDQNIAGMASHYT